MKTVGRPLARVDGVEKVTGAARYTFDLKVPGMVHAAVVRSPYPHARIRQVDGSRAAVRDGVLAVLTAGELKLLPGFDLYFGSALRDQPVLADGRVRYEGEPVAAVVAVDEATARWAAQDVEVDYEELPYAATLENALREGAPLVHETPPPAAGWIRREPRSNVMHHYTFEQGDVEKGLYQADRIFEDTFEFPMIFHAFLEPYVAIASFEGGRLTVYTSAQHPFNVQAALARQFSLPLSRVRVVVPPVGGGYGGKGYPKIEPLAAALARAVGRPVRLSAGMDGSFRTIRRAAARVEMRTGVTRDGRLVARRVTLYFQGGAYADQAPAVARKGGYAACGPYRIPHFRVDAYAVYTNTVPSGACRGFGVPQAAFAHESQMERIAHELGIDPLEIRLKNLLVRGDTIAPGETPVDADLAGGLRAVAARIGWGSPLPPRRGRGLAVAMKAPVSPSNSEAVVRLHTDGTATVQAATTELGQGARTVLAQIAAEELDLPLERVGMAETDTAAVPYDQSTSGSRSTTLMGLAVQRAAAQAKGRLAEAVRAAYGREPDGFSEGEVILGERRIPYGEVLKATFGQGGELIGHGSYHGRRGGTSQGGPVPFWEVGMAACEVEADPETGRVKVVALCTAADVGKAINPLLCEAQDEGGAMMGIGNTFFEELFYQDGQLVNPNLIDYRLPTFDDVPEEFHSILIENGDGPGPWGAKGAGESGVYVTGPAIANAVYAATGFRPRRLPVTPERLCAGLRRAES